MGDGRAILKQISERKNPDVYRHDHWEGSFTDYLDIVRQQPAVMTQSNRLVREKCLR